jgi:hypothetical protein
MNNDPQTIAEFLIREHGVDGAYQAALKGATDAQRDNDNYRLSVWREVKRIIREKLKPAA